MILDFDATPITIHSEKEHAAGHYKGAFGFNPLLATCGREVLAGILRPGNAGANNARDRGANAQLSSSGVSLGQSGALVGDSSTAAAFDGSGGAAHAEVDLSATHKLTVEFWLKWSAFAENDDLAMEFTPNFNEHPGGFLVNPNASGTDRFGIGLGEGTSRNNAFFARPSAETWHYYALVLDTTASGSTQITPYVDGHAVSYTKTAEGTEAGAFANAVLYWMSRDASSLFGTGSMQDLAVYETALSAGTIAEHYELGEGGLKAAFASTPASASVGVPVYLDASGSSSPAGTITDYAWDFNGSKSYGTDDGTSATATHTFTSPGTYTVDLRVKDSLGETTTISHTITVAAALGQYEQAVETTSGVAHFWPMGEPSGSTFADAIAGDNAETTGGVSLGEAGGLVDDSATSALFNGSSGAAHAALDLSSTHELTVEFWMKWNSYASDDDLALEFTPNFNEYPGGFLVDPDATPGSDFAVSIGQSGSRNTVYFERPTAGHWHYYTFVINTEAPAAEEITPYVDGEAVPYTKSEEGMGAGDFADSTLYWMSRDASALFGAGSMQDLALYDTTLSAGTVKEHYELGTTHAPTNITAPQIAGVAKKGYLLNANAGSWNGTPPLVYAYQWQRCDSFGEECVDISGATGASYLPSASDVSSTLRVRVTATNAAGSTSAASPATAVVFDSSCTDSWIGGHEGTWEISSNWSTGSVPNSADIACLASGTAVSITSNAHQVSALQGEGSLRIADGSLEVLSSSVASEVASLTLESSSLYGLGKLEVMGSMTASGTTMLYGSGTIDVHGMSSPSITASGELVIENTLEASDMQASEGEVIVDTGTLDLNGDNPSKFAHLTVDGNERATLTGSSEIDVAGSFDWENGTMSGTSKTVLAPGSSNKIDPFGPVTLNERKLLNKGVLDWESGAIVAGDGASITNQSIFYANDNGPHCIFGCDGVGISVGSGTASIENTPSGKLIKNAGLVTYFEIPLDNQGEVESREGQIQLLDGGVSGTTADGSWEAVSGGLVEFAGGEFNLGAGVRFQGEIALTKSTVTASALQAQGAKVMLVGATLDLEGPVASQIETLLVGQGPNGSQYATLEGSGEVDVKKTFEFYEGDIRGIDPLVLESGSAGKIDPVNNAILDSSLLVNKGTLNWYSGRIVGAGDAELLNEGVYETNDQGPHHECEGSCTGYYEGMQTADDLLEIFYGGKYFFGESAEGKAETFSGGALFVNNGETTDPEDSCPTEVEAQWWVEVQWPTTGSGSFNDPCTKYTSYVTPADHESPEEEEEGEKVIHERVGSPIAAHEDCNIEIGHHCYGLIETPNVNPPSGFLGSSEEIDPTCLATYGDNENFTDAEQWVSFTSGPQEVEKIKDWTEAGIAVGMTDEGPITSPHYFIADIRSLEGHSTYHEHDSHTSVSLDQDFQDEIWYLSGHEWEAWLPNYHMVSAPQPEFARKLQVGTENTANDVASEAQIRDMEYETTEKGIWRKGWRAEHIAPKATATSESTATATVTSGTTGEVSFNSRSC